MDVIALAQLCRTTDPVPYASYELRNFLTQGRSFATRRVELIRQPGLRSMHWIERKLIEIGRRKSDLAGALQLNRSRVSELVHGRRRLSVQELPAISRFLEIPVADVIRLETGDSGYILEPEGDQAQGVEPDESAARIYSATKEALDAFTRHGLDEMTAAEIDTYAKVIARCATRAEFKDARARKRHLESKVIELKDFRTFDHG